MLQETVERISPLIPAENVWVFTNDELRPKIRKQLPDVPAAQIIAEPEGRNTAPCIALAARLLAERDPNAVMAVLPSDHLIADRKTYLQTLARAARAVRLRAAPARRGLPGADDRGAAGENALRPFGVVGHPVVFIDKG